ncbi:hypothetical protein JXC34_05450 [Candidatus Woesearchaeota archaeon]|nr:hypothetical protein [Candidatus Woesearchaeota archaeon]
MKKANIILACVLVLLFIAGCTTSQQSQNTQETRQSEEVNALVVYHWWTSPGEAAAISSLVKSFSEAHPDVAIMPAPVYMQSQDFHDKVLMPMVFNGEAPDSFQGHPGYEIKPYYDAGTLETVDDIWELEDLESVIPKVIQDINKYKGNTKAIITLSL